MALEALQTRPSQPWLWLTPTTELPPRESLQGRGLRLHRSAGRFAGDARCAMPFPLPSESLQAIVVQHAVVGGAADFLAECERLLMPGGRLWLFTLNPMSPTVSAGRGAGRWRCARIAGAYWRNAPVCIACRRNPTLGRSGVPAASPPNPAAHPARRVPAGSGKARCRSDRPDTDCAAGPLAATSGHDLSCFRSNLEPDEIN